MSFSVVLSDRTQVSREKRPGTIQLRDDISYRTWTSISHQHCYESVSQTRRYPF